jgi:threonine dehydrogenase-like Zn-dependent dehydrogenase
VCGHRREKLGAKRIIALSRHPDRQRLAREFGATDIVDTRGDEAVEDVKKLTDGVGVDAALECVGTNEAMQTALAICRAGAIVGNVGLPHGADPGRRHLPAQRGVHGGPAPCGHICPN